jgi:hypothetical protein
MSIITGIFGFFIHLLDGLFGFIGSHIVILALAAVIAYMVVIHFHLYTKIVALEKSVATVGDSLWSKIHADANNLAEFISTLVENVEKAVGVNVGTPTKTTIPTGTTGTAPPK